MIPQKKQQNLFRFILKKTKNIEDAKDILQNAYLKYLEKEQSEKIDDPFSYIFGIIKIELLEYYRRITRDRPGYELKNIRDTSTDEDFEEPQDYSEAESFSNGEFIHDLGVYTRTKISWPEKTVKLRATIYKKSNLIVKNEPKNFKESLEKREVKYSKRFNTSARITKVISRNELLNYVEELENHKILSYDADLLVELTSIVNFDTSINVIRLYPNGFNCFSANDKQLAKSSIKDSHDKKAKWIFIKDSQIKMLKRIKNL